MLRRSEESLKRDIDSGIFKITSGNPMRRRGGDQGRRFEISQRDLEAYLGREKTAELFGKKDKKAKRKVRFERVPVEGRVKQCSSCGRLKPVSEFTRDLRYKDGLNPVCVKCLRDTGQRG